MKVYRYWVYMMASNLGNLYIGVTDDLHRRVLEHKYDIHDKSYTKEHQCHKLVYIEEYSHVEEAIAREKQLKGWIRKKKRDLIAKQNPGWKDLF
ncbi:MAG TPA: GIY-YIG nuclease family protein [Patescibacteria group bacterium]|nr:GIY-YIG nuclease family protein [Patescibacteria group bacterium]